MKRLILLAVIFASCASVYAADPTKPSKCNAAAYAGTDVVLVQEERSEYVSGRASVACALSQRLGVFGRGHLSGTQDGGGLASGNYESFRAVEVAVGVRYAFLGPVRASLLAGTTLSAEGLKDAPVNARLYTLGGTLGLGFGDGGYLEAGGAYDQRVGGAAALVAASVPFKGAYTTVDLALPIRAGALQQRAYQLRVGASVRVKRLLF